MRILQVSPQVPYPLSDGGKVGVFNITKHLALRGHNITMLAFERTAGVDTKPLQEFCELVTVPHSNKNTVRGAFRNLFSDLPYNMQKYRSVGFQHTLQGLLDSKSFDLVHVDHLHMAPYGIFCKEHAKLPIVLREHNVESVIVERYAERVRMPVFRQWMALQKKRIRSYEGEIAAQFDLCCAITEEDRKRLMELNPRVNARVIPAGVEQRYFQSEQPRTKIPHSIALFGSFDWLPNQDALEWFVSDIFPRIQHRQPEVRLYIIGKDIPHQIQARKNTAVVVRGFVPDLQQELQQYELTVVPLRIGGGMRLKILESFALQLPVVSTPIGCEGIFCREEEHLLIANTEEQFTNQVLRLLNNPQLQRFLAENAFKLASLQYRWEHVAEVFEETYNEARRLKTP
ncbi:MAG: glycosyltransferase family 4 protein [Bacteroidota bacterium]